MWRKVVCIFLLRQIFNNSASKCTETCKEPPYANICSFTCRLVIICAIVYRSSMCISSPEVLPCQPMASCTTKTDSHVYVSSMILVKPSVSFWQLACIAQLAVAGSPIWHIISNVTGNINLSTHYGTNKGYITDSCPWARFNMHKTRCYTRWSQKATHHCSHLTCASVISCLPCKKKCSRHSPNTLWPGWRVFQPGELLILRHRPDCNVCEPMFGDATLVRAFSLELGRFLRTFVQWQRYLCLDLNSYHDISPSSALHNIPCSLLRNNFYVL